MPKKKVPEGYHKTKDGRIAKRTLLLHEQKKKAGTSRKGKGTVSDKALKRSAKTAKVMKPLLVKWIDSGLCDPSWIEASSYEEKPMPICLVLVSYTKNQRQDYFVF